MSLQHLRPLHSSVSDSESDCIWARFGPGSRHGLRSRLGLLPGLRHGLISQPRLTLLWPGHWHRLVLWPGLGLWIRTRTRIWHGIFSAIAERLVLARSVVCFWQGWMVLQAAVLNTTRMVQGLPSGVVYWRFRRTHLLTWQCLRMPMFLPAMPPSVSRCMGILTCWVLCICVVYAGTLCCCTEAYMMMLQVFKEFLPHYAMLARYMLWPCLHLSVTSLSSTKMAKHMITQTTPDDSPGTLVSWCQNQVG